MTQEELDRLDQEWKAAAARAAEWDAAYRTVSDARDGWVGTSEQYELTRRLIADQQRQAALDAQEGRQAFESAAFAMQTEPAIDSLAKKLHS